MRYGAATGFAEHWVKQQLDEPSPALAHGPWLDVDKQIWQVDGAEVARLSVTETQWWTVAVRPVANASTDQPRLLAWIETVATVGMAHSYASWLTELCSDLTIRRAAA